MGVSSELLMTIALKGLLKTPEAFLVIKGEGHESKRIRSGF